jgi:hypothetical protein
MKSGIPLSGLAPENIAAIRATAPGRMDNFPKIVELRGRYFTPPYPADTIVEVTSLLLPSSTDRDRGDRGRQRGGGADVKA